MKSDRRIYGLENQAAQCAEAAGQALRLGNLALSTVIARSEATKQSILPLWFHGLLRFARNDDKY
jgi:hypothetical protein